MAFISQAIAQPSVVVMSQTEFYSICRSSAIHNVVRKTCPFHYDSDLVLTDFFSFFCNFCVVLIVLNVALLHCLKNESTQLGKRGKSDILIVLKQKILSTPTTAISSGRSKGRFISVQRSS